MHRVAVILAGGSGERFWPLSRSHRPKQFLSLGGSGVSMMEEALNRLKPTFDPNNVYVAASPHLKQPILNEYPQIPLDKLLIEPAKRNTAGAMVWIVASLVARGYEPDSTTLAVVTADHRIEPTTAFTEDVERALTLAESTDHLITIGIKPTRPETGYGYIEIEGTPDPAARVKRFHEKPNHDLAMSYVEQGNFFWNSGMFFWKLSTFCEELKQASPGHFEAFGQIVTSLKAGDEAGAERVFCQLSDISIDYALMERAKNVLTLPATFTWDDLGSWDAVGRYMDKDARGNSLKGDAVLISGADCMVLNESKNLTVALVGTYDLLVVATDDAVLVCHREHAQNVREVVKQLKESGRAKI